MSAETRTKLLSLARAMFGSVGYADVALEDLTTVGGMTRGALYHHFENKLGLFKAVVAEIEAELDREVKAKTRHLGERPEDAWEGLRLASHCYLSTVLKADVQQIMLRDAPTFYPGFANRPTKLRCHELTIRTLSGLKSAGKLDILDPEATANMIAGAIQRLASWAVALPEPDITQIQKMLDQYLASFGVR